LLGEDKDIVDVAEFSLWINFNQIMMGIYFDSPVSYINSIWIKILYFARYDIAIQWPAQKKIRGWLLLQKKKCITKNEKWGKGEKGRSSGHKLNIINDMTNIIILSITSSVVLSVKISRHCTIWLLWISL
jgi:hypothetical protein